MRNIYFINAALCIGLFCGYSNISGMGYKSERAADVERDTAKTMKVTRGLPPTPARPTAPRDTALEAPIKPKPPAQTTPEFINLTPKKLDAPTKLPQKLATKESEEYQRHIDQVIRAIGTTEAKMQKTEAVLLTDFEDIKKAQDYIEKLKASISEELASGKLPKFEQILKTSKLKELELKTSTLSKIESETVEKLLKVKTPTINDIKKMDIETIKQAVYSLQQRISILNRTSNKKAPSEIQKLQKTLDALYVEQFNKHNPIDDIDKFPASLGKIAYGLEQELKSMQTYIPKESMSEECKKVYETYQDIIKLDIIRREHLSNLEAMPEDLQAVYKRHKSIIDQLITDKDAIAPRNAKAAEERAAAERSAEESGKNVAETPKLHMAFDIAPATLGKPRFIEPETIEIEPRRELSEEEQRKQLEETQKIVAAFKSAMEEEKAAASKNTKKVEPLPIPRTQKFVPPTLQTFPAKPLVKLGAPIKEVAESEEVKVAKLNTLVVSAQGDDEENAKILSDFNKEDFPKLLTRFDQASRSLQADLRFAKKQREEFGATASIAGTSLERESENREKLAQVQKLIESLKKLSDPTTNEAEQKDLKAELKQQFESKKEESAKLVRSVEEELAKVDTKLRLKEEEIKIKEFYSQLQAFKELKTPSTQQQNKMLASLDNTISARTNELAALEKAIQSKKTATIYNLEEKIFGLEKKKQTPETTAAIIKAQEELKKEKTTLDTMEAEFASKSKILETLNEEKKSIVKTIEENALKSVEESIKKDGATKIKQKMELLKKQLKASKIATKNISKELEETSIPDDKAKLREKIEQSQKTEQQLTKMIEIHEKELETRKMRLKELKKVTQAQFVKDCSEYERLKKDEDAYEKAKVRESGMREDISQRPVTKLQQRLLDRTDAALEETQKKLQALENKYDGDPNRFFGKQSGDITRAHRQKRPLQKIIEEAQEKAK